MNIAECFTSSLHTLRNISSFDRHSASFPSQNICKFNGIIYSICKPAKQTRLQQTIERLPTGVQIWQMIYQRKLSDLINSKKLKNCQLR